MINAETGDDKRLLWGRSPPFSGMPVEKYTLLLVRVWKWSGRRLSIPLAVSAGDVVQLYSTAIPQACTMNTSRRRLNC